jgi:hypothetical protein
VSVGSSALYNNTTASNNTAVGYQAGYNYNGSYNTAHGYQAMYGSGTVANNTGGNNTGVGNSALFSLSTGSENQAFGTTALYLNTTGSYNTAIGRDALRNNSTASNNTAVGYTAGYSNVTGTQNSFFGEGSGYATTGNYNAFFGTEINYNGGAGSNNSGLGHQALRYATGSNITAVGYQAGNANTSGADGVYIGSGAGSNVTTGNGGIYIGKTSQANAATDGSCVVIGVNATGKGGSTFYVVAGGGSSYNGKNVATWDIASDQRLKKNIVDNTEGLSIISQIRVRNFEYRLPEEVTELPANQAIEKQGVQLGVIAQELQEVCSNCVNEETTGVLSVNSDNLTWHMINAIKDLKALVDAQATEITALKAKVGI